MVVTKITAEDFRYMADCIEDMQTSQESEEYYECLAKNCIKILSQLVTPLVSVGPQKKQEKPGRRARDPDNDQKILDRVEAGEKVQDIADELKISRQSVNKACNRAKAINAQKNIVQTPQGPYSPSNDQLRAAGVLLFGKRPGNNKDEIIKMIKDGIDFI